MDGVESADDRILVRLAGGDAAALAEAYDAHGAAVWRACRRLVGGADADHATQAVFIVLWRKAGRIRRGTPLAGWCHRAAVLVSRAHARGERRRRRRERAVDPARAAVAMDSAAAGDGAPDLDRAVARLPRAQRDAIALVYLDSRPRDEAARTLGISDDALRRRLSDALTALRRALGAATAAALANGSLPGGEPPVALRAAVDETGRALADGAPLPSTPAALAAAVGHPLSATASIGFAALALLMVLTLNIAIGRDRASSVATRVAPIDEAALGLPVVGVSTSLELPGGPPAMLGTAQRAHPDGGAVVLWSRNHWGNYPLSTYDFLLGLRGDHPDVANDVQLVFGNRQGPGAHRGPQVDSYPSSGAASGACGMDGGGAQREPSQFGVDLTGATRAAIRDLGPVALEDVAAPSDVRFSERRAIVVAGHSYLLTLKAPQREPRFVAIRVTALRDDDAVSFVWRPLPSQPVPPAHIQ